MSQFRHLNVDVVVQGQARRISSEDRTRFVQMYGLDDLIPNRYSEVLIVDLMMSLDINGIDPAHIIDEIKRLENLGDGYTKEATQFKHPPLHPLWHQHYFSAHYLIPNIQNEIKRDFKSMWDKSMGVEGLRIEPEHNIKNLVHNLVHGSIETRSTEKRLTGEWLIFSKQNTENIYLCMANHSTEDQIIYNKVAYCCEQQFPNLEPFATNRINNKP